MIEIIPWILIGVVIFVFCMVWFYLTSDFEKGLHDD